MAGLASARYLPAIRHETAQEDLRGVKDSVGHDDLVPPRLAVIGERALLVIVLATGLFLRVFRLETVPRGVLYDEAYNGIDVLRILAGAHPIFLPANYGREALFQYFQAVSVGLLGHSDWALRVPASICGIVTLPLSYLIVRRLFGSRVALLTCAWLAISLWHVMYSRIGLRTIALPVALAAAFYFLWCGLDELSAESSAIPANLASLRPPVVLWFGLAGASLGVSLYTYTTSRLAPLVVLAFAGYLAIYRRTLFRRALPAFVVAGLATILVFAPEGWYFLHHPESFVLRAREVSVFNPSLNQGDSTATLVYSAVRTLGMFSFLGDEQPDRNIPGRPIFDPFSSLLLAGGLARLLWLTRRSPRAVFLVLWLVILLLPSVTTARNVPNFLRVTGLIPAIFVLPALGAEWLWTLWERRGAHSLQILPAICVTLAFGLAASRTYQDYFKVWAQATAVSETFNADRWLTIEAAKSLARSGTTVYAGAGNADDPLQTYALTADPSAAQIHLFDGTRSLIFPSDATPVTYLFAQRDLPTSAILQHFFRTDLAQTVALAPDGEPVRSYVLQTNAPTLEPNGPIAARFGSVVQVLGYDVPRDIRAGDTLTVRWYWKLIGPASRELAFFNQLYDVGEVRRGQNDDRAFAPNYWPAGTTGISTFEIKVAPDTPTGPATLLVGIYTRDDLVRLPVVDGLGRLAGSQITLGPIKVHGQATPTPAIVNRQSAHFADGIELVGFDVTPVQGRAGQSVTLTLDWAARVRPTSDYTVFVHLVDAKGRLVGQADAPPDAGHYPTSVWDPGEIVEDRHTVALDPSLPPGIYQFDLGLYRPATGQRLPILAPTGLPADDHLVVGTVAVH